MRRIAGTLAAVLLLTLGLQAQDSSPQDMSERGSSAQQSSAPDSSSAEREYAFPLTNVQAALQQMGAFRGSRLPSLDGFIRPTRVKLDQYERPYYEYKIDLTPHGNAKTLVHVKANVSAWFPDPSGKDSGYQSFESNGRLESDLLDRLADFLNNNRATVGADAETLQKEINDAHEQRVATEQRIAELEQQLARMRDPQPQAQAGEVRYVSVARPGVAILGAPQVKASVVLRAQRDDEFEVAERRGAWLQVKLDDGKSGWVRSAEVEGMPTEDSAASKGGPVSGFSVIREMTSTFSGDLPRLKGKTALYVWARPEGSSLNVQANRKFPFAESVFMQRYQEVTHGANAAVAGIVVIFLDQAGGIVAASLDDIRQWADGNLSQHAFAEKCSLDPPSAFGIKR